jgi:hypothetical protein
MARKDEAGNGSPTTEVVLVRVPNLTYSATPSLPCSRNSNNVLKILVGPPRQGSAISMQSVGRVFTIFQLVNTIYPTAGHNHPIALGLLWSTLRNPLFRWTATELDTVYTARHGTYSKSLMLAQALPAYPKGFVLFRRGDTASAVYLIREGKIALVCGWPRWSPSNGHLRTG